MERLLYSKPFETKALVKNHVKIGLSNKENTSVKWSAVCQMTLKTCYCSNLDKFFSFHLYPPLLLRDTASHEMKNKLNGR